jgi:hypothetical protein
MAFGRRKIIDEYGGSRRAVTEAAPEIAWQAQIKQSSPLRGSELTSEGNLRVDRDDLALGFLIACRECRHGAALQRIDGVGQRTRLGGCAPTIGPDPSVGHYCSVKGDRYCLPDIAIAHFGYCTPHSR